MLRLFPLVTHTLSSKCWNNRTIDLVVRERWGIIVSFCAPAQRLGDKSACSNSTWICCLVLYHHTHATYHMRHTYTRHAACVHTTPEKIHRWSPIQTHTLNPRECLLVKHFLQHHFLVGIKREPFESYRRFLLSILLKKIHLAKIAILKQPKFMKHQQNREWPYYALLLSKPWLWPILNLISCIIFLWGIIYVHSKIMRCFHNIFLIIIAVVLKKFSKELMVEPSRCLKISLFQFKIFNNSIVKNNWWHVTKFLKYCFENSWMSV